jgi:hypothetical protein
MFKYLFIKKSIKDSFCATVWGQNRFDTQERALLHLIFCQIALKNLWGRTYMQADSFNCYDPVLID